MTVGVTTHNERDNITVLLDRLLGLPKSRIRIILYDDGSSDGTATLIAQHPLFRQENFQAHLADVNFGSPSVGRRFIAEHATTPYITFVDGDDLIDPHALASAAERLRPGFDIVMTPFALRNRINFVKEFDNARPISNTTISRLLSGIAGKIYNREAVFLHARDEIKGRSEDVRLNMRILLAGFDRVRIESVKPFYFIETSRKSTYSKNILPHELSARVANYRILKDRYGLDDIYLKTLHRNLLEVVQRDPTLTESERKKQRRGISAAMAFRFRDVIHVMEDLSSLRVRSNAAPDLIQATGNREIRHTWMALQESEAHPAVKIVQRPSDEQASCSFLDECHFAEAVVVIHDDSIKRFPISVQSRLLRLPLVHMRWLPLIAGRRKKPVQDAPVWETMESCAASRVVCANSQDVALYKQCGINELARINRPVRVRSSNTYDVQGNERLSYIVSPDCPPEEVNFLVELARVLVDRELPPLHVFATGDEKTPVLEELSARLTHVGVHEPVIVKSGVTARHAIYDQARIVILPPWGDSAWDRVLEAFSFGVPVIAPGYVPGAVEVIRDGEDGFVLDEYSAHEVASRLEHIPSEDYATLSRNCFARHQEFSVEQYLASIETIASEVARGFPGENSLPIVDGLHVLEALETHGAFPLPAIRSYARRKVFRLRGKAVRVLVLLRVAEPLRWIKKRMTSARR
ncbi:glycosyltransferase [Microvirga mediterraneensis]|uniref:Glycosyltransferase n=1 Tax=Microvirga mediterraneensis TaxID=2754695 RepID=A0A838BSZ6_9HYPH|nr:glycosyltransferase [Microvirga mediterraneensis]MBA1158169.1 glycosyltransferase [Microvirga mediterraneensis]